MRLGACVSRSVSVMQMAYSKSSVLFRIIHIPFVSSNVEDGWHRLPVGISKTQADILHISLFSYNLWPLPTGPVPVCSNQSHHLTFLLLACVTLLQLSLLADACRLLRENIVSKRQCLCYQPANHRLQIPARYGATLTSRHIFSSWRSFAVMRCKKCLFPVTRPPLFFTCQP